MLSAAHLHVAQHAEELRQVQTIVAIHGIPTHGLHKGVARGLPLLLADVGEAQGAIEAVDRRLHLHQLARVALDAAVRQALKGVGEAEPLCLGGIGAFGLDVFLKHLNEFLQQRHGRRQIAGHKEVLGVFDIMGIDR